MRTPARAARGQQPSAPRQSPRQAKHDAARRRAPPPAAKPGLRNLSAARWHSRLGTLRMARMTAALQCRWMAVAGRLIEHAVAARRIAERLGIGLLPDVERIEAGAQHEDELVAQHLAGGAQLALKTVALT